MKLLTAFCDNSEILWIVSFALVLLGPLSGMSQPAEPVSLFRPLQNSSLKLEGKTNVSEFTCQCKQGFQFQPFVVEKQISDRNTTYFKTTTLEIQVKSFDCGNKLMNKDLQKALHAAEFPAIQIELLEAEQESCNRLTILKDWVMVKTYVRITLNGHSKEYPLKVTAKKLAKNHFRFIAVKRLYMSDFGISPPTTMMGMIKVQNEIKIMLDLEIQTR